MNKASAWQVPDFVRAANSTAVVSGVPDFIAATVEYGPETINLKSRGEWVTAYIELPDGYDPAEIDASTVQITAIDGAVTGPVAAEQKPTDLGDFDNDGIPDLMVKFPRRVPQTMLTAGMPEIELQGQWNGELFIGRRTVGVILAGKSNK